MNGDINRVRATGTSILCYFCNENIPNAQLLQNHVKQCGSVLVECPKGCGSWIQRKHIVSHQRQCPPNNSTMRYNTMKTMPTRSSMYNTLEDKSSDTKLFALTENVDVMKKDMEVLKLNLNEEIIQRDSLKNEMEKMKRQYILSEDRNKILVTTVTTLRKSNEDNLTELKNEVNDFQLQYQKFNDFVNRIELRIDNLQQMIAYEQNERSHLELIVNTQDRKLRSVDKIEADLETIRNEKNYSSMDQVFTMEQEFMELKRIVSQESAQNKQQLDDYKKFQTEIERKIKESNSMSLKLDKIDYEMKSLKMTVEEDSSTLGMMDKSMNTLSKRMGALQSGGRASVEILQDLANSQPKIADVSGHLLWRIDYYHQKMKDAVDNGTVLTSQIFLTSKYGYTLQAELNLNGIGKWRGRHLTATVHIIPGEFDPILAWPASLQADIIIKDQTPKKSQAIDITKTLSVKTKDSHENGKITEDTGKKTDKRKGADSPATLDKDTYTTDVNGKRQYIFVPHTSLDKLDYIKNNVMFVEIIIQKSN